MISGQRLPLLGKGSVPWIERGMHCEALCTRKGMPCRIDGLWLNKLVAQSKSVAEREARLCRKDYISHPPPALPPLVPLSLPVGPVSWRRRWTEPAAARPVWSWQSSEFLRSRCTPGRPHGSQLERGLEVCRVGVERSAAVCGFPLQVAAGESELQPWLRAV